MAFDEAIVRALRYCGTGVPYKSLAASVIDVTNFCGVLLCAEVVNVTAATSSSLFSVTTLMH